MFKKNMVLLSIVKGLLNLETIDTLKHQCYPCPNPTQRILAK